MAEYRIGARAKLCAATGESFQEGQVIVSAIYDDPREGFSRRDFSESGFAGHEEGAFSVWRGRVPVTPEEAHKLDFDLAQTFYERLLSDADPASDGIVYTLTLLLARKRRVKITQTRPLPDGELLTVVVPGPEEDREVSVRAPRLGAGDVERLQCELAGLFGFAQPAPADTPEPEDEPRQP